MSALHVTLDLVRHHLRRPLGWLLVVLLLLSWPALRTFLPLGLVTADLHHWTGAYEVAFLGGALVIVLGMAPLDGFSWLLRPAGPSGRIALQGAALTLTAALAGALALVPAHLFHEWQLVSFRAGESLGALVLGWLHVAALALCALQLPLEPRVRAILVLALVTVVPGLLTGETGAGRAALSWLDAGETLRGSFEFPLASAHWIGAGLPIFGWVACALALAAPGPPRDPTHEIRDPR